MVMVLPLRVATKGTPLWVPPVIWMLLPPPVKVMVIVVSSESVPTWAYPVTEVAISMAEVTLKLMVWVAFWVTPVLSGDVQVAVRTPVLFPAEVKVPERVFALSSHLIPLVPVSSAAVPVQV